MNQWRRCCGITVALRSLKKAQICAQAQVSSSSTITSKLSHHHLFCQRQWRAALRGAIEHASPALDQTSFDWGNCEVQLELFCIKANHCQERSMRPLRILCKMIMLMLKQSSCSYSFKHLAMHLQLTCTCAGGH